VPLSNERKASRGRMVTAATNRGTPQMGIGSTPAIRTV
jgi:hypothetical protein